MRRTFRRVALGIVPKRLIDWLRRERAKRRASGEGEEIFDEICTAIDVKQLTTKLRKSASTLSNDPAAAAKYYNHHTWLRKGIADAIRFGLHREKGLKVLDVGCGPGWFLTACAHLGHQCTGMDLPFEAMRPEDRSAYESLPMILHCADRIVREPVEAFTPIPVDGQFDLITCMLICFDGHWKEDAWGVNEWTYFLDDMDRLLTPVGRLYLQFNRKPSTHRDLAFYDRPTQLLLASKGRFESKFDVIIKKRRASLNCSDS